MTTIVTGWTGRNYDRLGNEFVRSYKALWPDGVWAMIFRDEPGSTSICDRCVECIIGDHCEGLADFVERHRLNNKANGREPNERWKDKEVEAGYSFRFDAVKFSLQLFIPEAAQVQLADDEILVWFDADVLTKRAVPERFLEGLIGDADLVHLGREPKHSEIGFWAVRLSPLTRSFLRRLADLYRTDKLFELKEWHSAFVFDVVRREFEAKGMRSKNLTPGGRGHVWPGSPLGRYTEHLKGKRKMHLQRAA